MSQLLTSLTDLPATLQKCAVTVGNFDGVHRGHARLVAKLVETARRLRTAAVVMTFDPPPTALLFPDRPLTAPLTTIKRRAHLLGELGVDALIAYPTDRRLLQLSAQEFFDEVLMGRLQIQAIVEGPNFRFGKDRLGDVDRLREMCSAEGVDAAVVQANEDADGMVSSTRVRNLLTLGDAKTAAELLTEPYMLVGEVVEGAARGRQLGFPTANLSKIETLIPGYGVYAGRASCPGIDNSLPAAINIGPNLTFEEQESKVEVHIIGYSGEPLYGQTLSVTFHEKVRDIQKFASLEALKEQVAKDISQCELLSST